MELDYKQYKKLQRYTTIIGWLKIAVLIVFVGMLMLKICIE
jgi:hypothetical protein